MLAEHPAPSLARGTRTHTDKPPENYETLQKSLQFFSFRNEIICLFRALQVQKLSTSVATRVTRTLIIFNWRPVLVIYVMEGAWASTLATTLRKPVSNRALAIACWADRTALYFLLRGSRPASTYSWGPALLLRSCRAAVIFPGRPTAASAEALALAPLPPS